MLDQQSRPDESGKHRHRSPAYPAISLRKALERATQFQSVQKHHAAPVSGALNLWEFKAKSSGGLQVISALKQFGLMTESGEGETRQVQLTDLALRIIRDEREPSSERDQAIRKAALTPKIYTELWSKWGADLPGEATIRFFLEHEKKYNGTYISDLIADYKDTIAFANLAEIDKILPEDGSPNEPHEDIGRGGEGADSDDPAAAPPLPRPSSPPSMGVKLMEGERELTTGLLSKNASFRLIVSGDVGEKEIARLIAKLQLDKEILADPDSNDSKE